MCKLTLAGELLSADNELMMNLLCSVYADPPPLELIWSRNNQQLQANKSDQVVAPGLSTFKTTVMVLNRQQEYMLADLAALPSANFRCIARNQFGYSKSCELNQLERQTLLSEYTRGCDKTKLICHSFNKLTN